MSEAKLLANLCYASVSPQKDDLRLRALECPTPKCVPLNGINMPLERFETCEECDH